MAHQERHHPLEPRVARWIGHYADAEYRKPWNVGISGTILAAGALAAAVVEIPVRTGGLLAKNLVKAAFTNPHRSGGRH